MFKINKKLESNKYFSKLKNLKRYKNYFSKINKYLNLLIYNVNINIFKYF